MSNVDGSEQSRYAAGWVNFHTTPGVDAGTTSFSQRLVLHDGVLSTTYDDRKITIFGAANSELIGIHVEDPRTNVTQAVLELSIWDTSALGTWKTVTTFADNGGIGLSRGLNEASQFGYTLAATADGASFVSQTVSASSVRLTISPSKSYTIWIDCASRLNATNHDSVAAAKAALVSAKSAGYTKTLADYQAFW